MQRLIVTSATYRQSVQASRRRWSSAIRRTGCWRVGRAIGLPSWMIRDQALAASGLLVEQARRPVGEALSAGGDLGGSHASASSAYKQDHGDALYRRSLYIFWRRIVGPTDVLRRGQRGKPARSRPRRTNTPLHALVTLNDMTYAEAARALAERVLQDGRRARRKRGSKWLSACALRGEPTDAEMRSLLQSPRSGSMSCIGTIGPRPSGCCPVGESPRNEQLDVGRARRLHGLVLADPEPRRNA